MLLVNRSMAKLTDTQKDKGNDEENDSFVNFVITKLICKDPWGRLARYTSFRIKK